RVPLRGIVRIGNRPGTSALFWRPLVRAGRALRQLPFVVEQVTEEIVAPLRRRLCPGHFQAAADGVGALASSKRVLPAEPLLLDIAPLRFGSNILSGNRRTVSLAECVAAGNQRNRLLVMHRHTAKRFTDVPRGGDWIRFAIRPFRIYINQAHLDCAKRAGQVAITAVSFVAQPFRFRSPIKLFGLPDVLSPASKTESLETHRLQSDVAGENQQVGPRNFAPVLLLDRPKKAARLVQVHVIRPTIERRKALLPGSRTSAAVANAVSAGAVP